jgi:hypothetical protein
MKIKTILLVVAALGLFAATVSAAPQNLVIILDASNSMNKPFDMGTRIEAARAALDTILSEIPEGGNVGLLVFGHRIGHENEVESCQDIEFLFPVAPFTRAVGDQMIAAIDQIVPQGKTPLADSLTAAANELAQDGTGGVIVLISDGEGNCGGQQLTVAKMLSTMTPPITLHVVGLDIEAEASETLRAMAFETGGSYWSVQQSDALVDALFAAIGTTAETTAEFTESGIPPAYACYGVTNVIYGTDGDDTLYGTAGNDLIFGLSGNDFLIGLDGNDVLVGGPGNDIIEGGNGQDTLDGGDGGDLMFGGAGNDVLCGGAGNDSLEGDAGDDILDGGEGSDSLLGGAGNDTLFCADAADILMEGAIVSGTYGRCPSGCGIPCPVPTPATASCANPVQNAPSPQAACPVMTPAPASTSACPTPGAAKVVDEGQSIPLHGSASDSDCDILTTLWEVSAGTLSDPSSLDPIYTAPMLPGCDDADVHVTLTAVDTCGASACDSFTLHIRNVNHAPTIQAGDDLWINEGTAVVIQATSQDPDGDALVYGWAAGGNLGTFDNPSVLQATYHAPMIDACDGVDIPLQVTVTDPCGATACDTLMVHVRNVNNAPTIELGPDFAVDEGSVVRLTPVISDPECDPLTYCWSTTGGVLNDANGPTPTLCTPKTDKCDGETLVVTLKVTDPCGLTATDSVKILVRNVNSAPTVNLGPDLCVVEGSTLQLMPTVNDPDGDTLKYTWAVSAGRLDSFCSSAPIFIAPMTSNCDGADVTVTLTVTDPCGLAASDSLTIRIANVNMPPTVVADP